MPVYYTYLLSSLPMLHFGAKPPFSYEKFIQTCSEFVPGEDIAMLKALAMRQDEQAGPGQATLKKWHDFEAALGNELVKLRAGRKKLDPSTYLRCDGTVIDSRINHIAMNAYKNTSPLEAEKVLDQGRWQMYDEFSAGHYFDIDALIVYGLKLLLLIRWEKIRTSDKVKLLEALLRESEPIEKG
ncbi:MAG: DUF2764 family protein [Candidatus Omnitrophica bacterium]|nr:DUF2764 family protein [Candidatus Omnitrophota bacterium]